MILGSLLILFIITGSADCKFQTANVVPVRSNQLIRSNLVCVHGNCSVLLDSEQFFRLEEVIVDQVVPDSH